MKKLTQEEKNILSNILNTEIRRCNFLILSQRKGNIENRKFAIPKVIKMRLLTWFRYLYIAMAIFFILAPFGFGFYYV